MSHGLLLTIKLHKCIVKVFFFPYKLSSDMDDETLIGFDDTATLKPEVKQKNGKRSGGFQAMGLSFPVLKGVLKRGYKVPTPIQRKVCFNCCVIC